MLVAKMPDGKPEVYPAFQGEGRTTNELCVFVRTSGCSLRCTFCDTSYTWFFEGDKLTHKYSLPANREKYSMRLNPDDMAIAIRKAAGPIRRVVFTGGEPLLQQGEIIEIIKLLRLDKEYWMVEIETNGTIKMNDELAELVNYINCSPKMENSGNPKDRREKVDVLEQFLEIDAYNDNIYITFKFVVGIDTFKEDLKEIRAWEKRNRIPRDLICLMPEGIEPKQIIEGTKYLFENACKKYGYRLSTRLQVLIYGNKRAV